MKKLFIIFISLLAMSSCSTTRENRSARGELRKEKKLVDQALVKNAVESKRYIIKFERIFINYGGVIELMPRANYLIVDREKAILNTVYVGRQFDIKPIAAINIHGRAINYAVTDNLSKGSYEIKMKVNNGRSNTFDVYVTISKDGSCSASVSSLKIDNVRYSGYLVPIMDQTNTLPGEGNNI
jgi:expansin (peptidoglycan-binding protein)